MAAKKKAPEPAVDAEVVELRVNPFTSSAALAALATDARSRAGEVAAAVHPNNVFALTLHSLADKLDEYAALMDERGHDGIPPAPVEEV